jgi:hypothetical protein
LKGCGVPCRYFPAATGRARSKMAGRQCRPAIWDHDLNALEHDPEKWKPVFRKDHAQTKRFSQSLIQLG